MNCPRWERKIALYVEGDLPAAELLAVVKHLNACEGCREFCDGLKVSQEAVKGLGKEEADGQALGEVRRRVMAQVESRRPSWVFGLRWWHAAPVAVAVLLAVFLLWPRYAEVPPPPLVAFEPPPPPSELRPPQQPRPASAKPARRRAEPEVESEPLLVKFFTDDPDVVVYWIIDPKGGKS